MCTKKMERQQHFFSSYKCSPKKNTATQTSENIETMILWGGTINGITLVIIYNIICNNTSNIILIHNDTCNIICNNNNKIVEEKIVCDGTARHCRGDPGPHAPLPEGTRVARDDPQGQHTEVGVAAVKTDAAEEALHVPGGPLQELQEVRLRVEKEAADRRQGASDTLESARGPTQWRGV